jgi:hypothetical protein
MKEDRFFRVIVLGGLSLIGSSACGRNASNGSALDGDPQSVGDAEMSSGIADGGDEIPPGRDGGPNDLRFSSIDAGDDASLSPDADLASDAATDSADGQACGFESFPAETAIATCYVRCVPAGCPCVIPATCTCSNCATDQ